MEKLLSGDFPFYRFRNLSAYPELMHFVSSGVKNIGFSDRENPEIIQHNRRSLAEAAGFEVERLITARQVHSATVRIVTAEEAGRGALDRESRIPATDALVKLAVTLFSFMSPEPATDTWRSLQVMLLLLMSPEPAMEISRSMQEMLFPLMSPEPATEILRLSVFSPFFSSTSPEPATAMPFNFSADTRTSSLL